MATFWIDPFGLEVFFRCINDCYDDAKKRKDKDEDDMTRFADPKAGCFVSDAAKRDALRAYFERKRDRRKLRCFQRCIDRLPPSQKRIVRGFWTDIDAEKIDIDDADVLTNLMQMKRKQAMGLLQPISEIIEVIKKLPVGPTGGAASAKKASELIKMTGEKVIELVADKVLSEAEKKGHKAVGTAELLQEATQASNVGRGELLKGSKGGNQPYKRNRTRGQR